jgi:hypothetical protein
LIAAKCNARTRREVAWSFGTLVSLQAPGDNPNQCSFDPGLSFRPRTK